MARSSIRAIVCAGPPAQVPVGGLPVQSAKRFLDQARRVIIAGLALFATHDHGDDAFAISFGGGGDGVTGKPEVSCL